MLQSLKEKNGQHNCTIRVPTFDIKLFAMQHAGFIRVTAPRELADEIRDELKKAWKNVKADTLKTD